MDDRINSVLSAFDKKNKEIEDLFQRIEQDTDSLLDKDVDRNYETVLKVEFILVKLRIVVSHELSLVKMAINSEIPTAILTAFKKREQLLLSLVQRLNELRDDITTVQRSIYTKGINKI